MLRLYVHTNDDAVYRQVGDALADSDYEVLRARQPSDVPPAERAQPVTVALVHLTSSLDASSTVAAWAGVDSRYGALLIAGVDAEETVLRRQLIGLGVDDFLPDPIGSARWWERLALTEQRLNRLAAACAESESERDVAGTRMSRHGEPAGFPCNLCDAAEQRQATQALERERRLLADLLELQERDRRLIAYEIHDGVAQKLTGTLYHLQSAIRLQQEGSDQAQSEFNSALKLLTQCIAETRQLISGLRPPILDELGIVAALDYLSAERSRESACTVRFQHDVRFQRLAPALENALFRIVQESLTNACRHGKSDLIWIDMNQRDDRLRVEVRDRGVGFDPQQVPPERFGLRGIRERARLFEGSAEIESAPGQGTRVVVELPITEGSAARLARDHT